MAEPFSTHQTIRPMDDEPTRRRPRRTNVGRRERMASMVGGGALALYGLSRGSLRGLMMAAAGGGLIFRGATGHSPTYEAMGIDTAQGEVSLSEIRISEAITIDRPRGELYAFWRDLENLPQFMRHLEKVRPMDEKRSVWTARAPKGMGTLTWEAEITEDRPGEVIAWRSLPAADVENAGTVLFEPGPKGEGTVLRVMLEYRPSGMAGAAAALLNPIFSQMIREDIRRFKSLMEAGEIPTIEGQPVGG